MRRILMVLSVAALMAAMMVASAMPALAQPEDTPEKSQNSCVAPNPNIGSPPSRFNKTEEEFADCGMRNNPQGGPPSLEGKF